MRIFSAGSAGAGKHEELCRKIGVPKLYCYMSGGERKRIAAYDPKEWGIPLLGDSGAYSYNQMSSLLKTGFGGKKDLPDPRKYFEDYFEFIKANRMKPITFAELDIYAVLPKAEIDEQYRRVKALGGAIEYMRVYHTRLDGGTGEELQKWVREGHKYVGFGVDAMPIFGKLFGITRDKVKVHGFAMTRMPMLTRFPFFSVDSTTALTSCIFGTTIEGNLKVVSKAAQVRDRKVDAIMSDETKLEKALRNFKATERMVTDLWRQRGVVWDESF